MRRSLVRLLSALVASASLLVFAAPPASALHPDARLYENVIYERVEGQVLRMDIEVPKAPGPHPGVLLVHGGAFHVGDKGSMRPLANFLSSNGYVTFAIDYRLAPDFPYPAAVQDAEAAVRFMRENASRYDLDPARIGALGGSAGGTIVASLGTELGRGATGSRVAAAVAWSGLMDMTSFANQRASMTDVVDAYVFGAQGGSSGTEGSALRAASPVCHVGPGDPPMFLANSRDELMPYDQALQMLAALRRAGVPAQLFTPSGGHSFRYASEAEGPSLDFLERYVRTYSGTSDSSVGPSDAGDLAADCSVATTLPATHASARPKLLLGLGAAAVVLAVALAIFWTRRRGARGRSTL